MTTEVRSGLSVLTEAIGHVHGDIESMGYVESSREATAILDRLNSGGWVLVKGATRGPRRYRCTIPEHRVRFGATYHYHTVEESPTTSPVDMFGGEPG